jgi:hypothetical protein
MKTYYSILLLICAMGIAMPLNAQVQKGQTFLSGGLSFFAENGRNTAAQNSKNDGLNFNLGVGQLLSNKLALSLGFNYSRNKNSGFNEVFTPLQLLPNGEYLYSRATAVTAGAYSAWGLSIGLNNYIPLRERLAVVLSSSVSANFRSNEFSQQILGQNRFITESKQNDYALQFSPGLWYFLSPRFALSSRFSGFSLTVTPKSEGNGTSTISGGLSTEGILGIGLNYFFK